jgi:Flp pilus assembly protein TadB
VVEKVNFSDWSEECFTSRRGASMLRDFLFLMLFFIFLAIWLVGWVAFHVAAGGIHLLLALAVIFLLIHLFRGGRRAA